MTSSSTEAAPTSNSLESRAETEPCALAIEILNSPGDISRARDFWERHQSNPRVDFVEYSNSIQSRSDTTAPFVLALRRQGELSALVIGRIDDIALRFRLAYWEPISTPIRTLLIEHGGVMGDMSAAEAELMAAEILTAAKDGAASIVKVRYLATASPLYVALRKVTPLLSSDPVIEFNQHWTLDLPETYQKFYKSRSKNTQSNFRQYSNRVIKEFGDRIRIVRYGKLHELESAVQAVESIASRTYHRGLGIGFADTPELRAAWAREAERGWLCVHLLLIDDRPTAFWAGKIYRGRYILEFTGYDPDLEYYHLGQFLWLKAIDEFCASREINIYDFGHSDEPYKRSIGTAATEEACFCIFPPTGQGAWLKLLRIITSGTTMLAKFILKETNFLSRFKKAIKKSLTRRHV